MGVGKEKRAEIEQLRRQSRDKKQHIPLSVLVILDEGFTYEVIAASLGIGVLPIIHFIHFLIITHPLSSVLFQALPKIILN